MSKEHRIDLAAGTDEHLEVEADDQRTVPDPAITEDFRKKEAALARLRGAALENIDIRDILTLMGY